MSDLLQSIESQIESIKASKMTPAVIKMSPDTWAELARGVLPAGDLHEMRLLNLRVMLDQSIKSGVARVYQEWV